MGTQENDSVPAWAPADVMALRASDADRDQAAHVLNAAFAEGRLTADEHDQRLEAAYAARTRQQLREVTADLPAPASATAELVPWAEVPAGTDPCLLCLLLVVCPPAGIAWWLLSRRRLAQLEQPSSLIGARPGSAISGYGLEHAQDR